MVESAHSQMSAWFIHDGSEMKTFLGFRPFLMRNMAPAWQAWDPEAVWIELKRASWSLERFPNMRDRAPVKKGGNPL